MSLIVPTLRRVLVLILPVFFFILSANPAAAAPQFTFDIKVNPDEIVAGKTMDIPLYLVENRPAAEKSTLEGVVLRMAYGNFRSAQSTIVSFTPREEFDEARKVYIVDDGHRLIWELDSIKPSDFTPGSDGIPVQIDNSGIIGRTEIFLGYIRMLIGPEIAQDDGIGDADAPIIFQAELGFSFPYSARGYVKKSLSTGSHIGGGPVDVNAIRINGPDPDATPCERLQIFPEKGDLCEFKIGAEINPEQPNKLLCSVGLRGEPKGKFKPIAIELKLETGKQKAGVYEVFGGEVSSKANTIQSNRKGKASFNIKSVPKGQYVRCAIKDLVQSTGIKIKRPGKPKNKR